MKGAFSFRNGGGAVSTLPTSHPVSQVAGAADAGVAVASVTPVVAASATNDKVTVRFNFSLAIAASHELHGAKNLQVRLYQRTGKST
jgi:hypothetical protein